MAVLPVLRCIFLVFFLCVLVNIICCFFPPQPASAMDTALVPMALQCVSSAWTTHMVKTASRALSGTLEVHIMVAPVMVRISRHFLISV